MKRMIVVEGTDGIGKTSLINGLTSLLERDNRVYLTRALGGDGTCEFQKAIRGTILSNKFPKEEAILEEALFAMADLEGNRQSKQALTTHGIALKDRGLVSHLSYAVAKGMDVQMVSEMFEGVAKSEAEIAAEVRLQYVVLVPDDVTWALKRVQARSQAGGEQVIDRLENKGMQERVASRMMDLAANNGEGIKQWLPVGKAEFTLIQVVESDTREDVLAKVQKALGI